MAILNGYATNYQRLNKLRNGICEYFRQNAPLPFCLVHNLHLGAPCHYNVVRP